MGEIEWWILQRPLNQRRRQIGGTIMMVHTKEERKRLADRKHEEAVKRSRDKKAKKKGI